MIVAAPIRLRVELTRPDQIDRALRVPGSQRVDGVTIEWSGNEMVSVYHAFRAIVGLGIVTGVLHYRAIAAKMRNPGFYRKRASA